MKHFYALFLFVSYLTVGCTGSKLDVRSEYYSRKNLASVVVDTPDPRKESSDFGQRLVLNWSVPEKTFREGDVELILCVRLKNGEEKTTRIALTKSHGKTFYPIFGKDYTKKGGLQSYFAKLQSQGKVLAKSKHKLWVEKLKK